MDPTAAFMYLGDTVAYNNSNWSDLYPNLNKASRRWSMVVKVMIKAGVAVRAQTTMYKSVVHTFLLYGS